MSRSRESSTLRDNESDTDGQRFRKGPIAKTIDTREGSRPEDTYIKEVARTITNPGKNYMDDNYVKENDL